MTGTALPHELIFGTILCMDDLGDSMKILGTWRSRYITLSQRQLRRIALLKNKRNLKITFDKRGRLALRSQVDIKLRVLMVYK
jgi:hypothetical protein